MVIHRIRSSFALALALTVTVMFAATEVLLPSALAFAAESELDLTPLNEPNSADEPAIAPIEERPQQNFSEEMPEEILRTEIITEGRSPLTGESLTAVEYAQLQAELASPAGGNLVSQDIEYLIFLLQLRRAVKPIIPFIP